MSPAVALRAERDAPRPDPLDEGRAAAHATLLEANRSVWEALLGTAGTAGAGESPIRPGSLAQAVASPVVGDSRTWFEYYTASNYMAVVRAVCDLPTGRRALFRVDPAATTAGTVTDAILARMQAEFCGGAGGYALVTGVLGDVWGSAAATRPTQVIPEPAGAPQDVHIVFLYAPPDAPWAGYFWGGNNFLKTIVANSNEALAFFVNGSLTNFEHGPTILHELTHMVNLHQRFLVRNLAANDTWLAEMQAMMTSDFVDGLVIPSWPHDPKSNAPSPYLMSGGGISLVNWDWDPSVAYRYHIANGALGLFLNHRYGLEIYRHILDCPDWATSYSCLDALIRGYGGDGYPDELARMGASVFGLVPLAQAPPGYGFPGWTDGVFTVDAGDMAAWASKRPPTATALGAQFPATTQTYVVDGIGGSAYLRSGVEIPPGVTLVLVIQ